MRSIIQGIPLLYMANCGTLPLSPKAKHKHDDTATDNISYLSYICALALVLAALSAACGSDAPSGSPTSGTTAAPATEEAERESAPTPGSVATDGEVLVAFYNAMDGDNWTNNANWLSEAPLGEMARGPH